MPSSEYPGRDPTGRGGGCYQTKPNPRWANHPTAPLLNVVLRRVLPDWLAREPDNPYVAVFAPLLIEDDADSGGSGFGHCRYSKRLRARRNADLISLA
ncbi:MAG: hypothetical protein KAX64_02080 [Chromatiaceae bacterium]|nr:hypothetical protein [Chromatiaceae bacterium]MBP8197327.1 hypothetical protein [Chromatiaceae bacterium]